MFERIFVPLDGSARAERALDVAAHIARASHGKIILVCIINHFILGALASPVLANLQSAEDTWSIDDAETYLQSLVDAPELSGLWTEKAVMSGPIAATLVNAAATYSANLIVMCSHGHSGVVSRPLGSVAEKVVCRTTIPVLLLREHGTLPIEPYLDAGKPLRILVALNNSSSSHAILKPTAELAVSLVGPASGILHLIRVTAPTELTPQTPGQQGEPDREPTLSMAITDLPEDPLADYKIAARWDALESRDVAEALVQIKETEAGNGTKDSNACKVIAIATHELAGYQQFPRGSVAARVMAETTLPIFFAHTPA
ncbi:universal stress protein UspA [Dictyobacter vulcani]|uniref:Universal stress protein UspA n=1 Tax=Dictyobacter vulcani TaxID=2607529 RepID=A0A5J4KU20_9CHLR|nr:universal stress protein [Dictyobacter vulcani]GER90682.1 universal stress protein UspA [Dictyobacter vulcani]